MIYIVIYFLIGVIFYFLVLSKINGEFSGVMSEQNEEIFKSPTGLLVVAFMWRPLIICVIINKFKGDKK